VIIPSYPIRDEALRRIVVLKLAKIQRRIRENHRIELVCGDDVVREVAGRCTEVESGARNVDNILTNTLLPAVSRRILSGIARQEKLDSIQVTIGDDGAFAYS
jgi:type VI secretion system protein VasG